jgi:hypothetical protein
VGVEGKSIMKLSCTNHSLVLAFIATALLLAHSEAFAIGPTYSGSWYNPEQSGHGFSLEYSILNDGTPWVAAFWYIYDTEGNPFFLVGSGEPGEENSVTLEFEAPYGMRFGEFIPEQTVREDGGTGVFTFVNEESGVFDYQPSVWIANTYGLSAITTPVSKLLGVAHPNLNPPQTGSPFHLMGLWSGRMIYDRTNFENDTCFDADVLMSVAEWNGNKPGYIELADITISRDGGSTSSTSPSGLFIQNNYVTGNFYTLDLTRNIEFSLRFDDYGLAEGTWKNNKGSDCYGTWSFYKE